MEEALCPNPGQLQRIQRDFQVFISLKFLTGIQIQNLMDNLKSTFFLNPFVLVCLSRAHKTKVPRGTMKEMSMSKVEN